MNTIRLKLLCTSFAALSFCSITHCAQPEPNRNSELVDLQNKSGLRRIVPRQAAVLSKLFAQQLVGGASAIACDASLNLIEIAELLWGLYQYRDLQGRALLEALYQDHLAQISTKYCNAYHRSMNTQKMWSFEIKDLAADFVTILKQTEIIQCKPLQQALAYTCAKHFKPGFFYRKLLACDAIDSAYEFARYAFLLDSETVLKECTTQIPIEKNFLSGLFSAYTLEVPKGHVTFSLQEYMSFRPRIPEGHMVQAQADFRGLMLSDITGLPNLAYAQELQSLDFSNNYLQTLCATALLLLPQLRRLNVSGNQIKRLPSLSTLTALEELDISDNRLKRLPALSALTRLEYLNASHNQLITLEGVGLSQLTSLQRLDVSHNQLPVAPEWATRLRSVNFENNRQ